MAACHQFSKLTYLNSHSPLHSRRIFLLPTPIMSDILLLDGGLGTSLEQKYHVQFTPSTPLWSSHLLISDPDTLLACQRDFGAVPVDVILTATYQISLEGFAATRTAEYPNGIPVASIPRFIDNAVTIAETAKQHHAAIALSMGPYGACMTPSQEYTGAYDAAHNSTAALEAWHRERMQLFARSITDLGSRVRFLALETVPRVDEIVSMRTALGSLSDNEQQLPALPFWISCLFPGEVDNLPDGTSAEDAVTAMLDSSMPGPVPWGVGINCTKTWKLDSLLRRYESAIARLVGEGQLAGWPALVLYPDGTSGEVYNTETQTWELPAGTGKDNGLGSWGSRVADVVRRTREEGEWRQIVVGGCCMASDADIARLRGYLSSDGI